MKTAIYIRSAVLAAALLSAVAEAGAVERLDTAGFTASRAFISLDAPGIELLNRSSRLDLLDYMAADTLQTVYNSLDGETKLSRPLTSDYLKVQLTPVSTMTFRILPGKKENVLVTVYTLGGGSDAADSDVRFYDPAMTELKRDKYFKHARLENFLTKEGRNHKEKQSLLDLIPFPTVEYRLSPDNTSLTARLTVEGYLTQEDYEKVKPYLVPEIVYLWTGKNYELKK